MQRKIIATLAVIIGCGSISAPAQPRQPAIHLIQIPPLGPGGESLYPIAGTVEGAPADAVVVIWARSSEGINWVQPWGNAYQTPINADGSWKTQTHPGFEYSVAVARTTFSTAMTRMTLPPVGKDILAMVTVPGR
jgi:hypothetical protein